LIAAACAAFEPSSRFNHWSQGALITDGAMKGGAARPILDQPEDFAGAQNNSL
jgi:hypothetical protein